MTHRKIVKTCSHCHLEKKVDQFYKKYKKDATGIYASLVRKKKSRPGLKSNAGRKASPD
jgi:hypothetical protein